MCWLCPGPFVAAPIAVLMLSQRGRALHLTPALRRSLAGSLLVAMANDQRQSRKRCRAIEIKPSHQSRAGPGQATVEGIDRNYAIKIKTMWCHFYGSFSMPDARCPTFGLSQVAGGATEIARTRCKRDGNKVIIYNCPLLQQLFL